MQKSDLIQKFIEYGFLVDNELIDYLLEKNYSLEHLNFLLSKLSEYDITNVTLELFTLMEKIITLNSKLDLNWSEIEKSAALSQKNINSKSYLKYLNYFKELIEEYRQGNDVDNLPSEQDNAKADIESKNVAEETSNENKTIQEQINQKILQKQKDLTMKRIKKRSEINERTITALNQLKDKKDDGKLQKNENKKTKSTKNYKGRKFKKQIDSKSLTHFLFSSDMKHDNANENTNDFQKVEIDNVLEDTQKRSLSDDSETLISDINASEVEKNQKDDLEILNKEIEEDSFANISQDLSFQQLNVFKEILNKPLPFSYDAYINSKIENLGINVLFSYFSRESVNSITDFITLFKNRYESISRLIRAKPHMSSVMPIRRIKQFKNRSDVGVIGFVNDINFVNGNYYFSLEDETGVVEAIVSPKSKTYENAKLLVNDEIIGAIGFYGNKFYVNEIIFPDVTINDKRFDSDDLIVFISDIHAGSKQFLPHEFQLFFDWLNLKLNDPKLNELAKRVKYVIVIGDLVDGVGIYPNQDSELNVLDIFDQYALFTKFIRQIPPHIKVIIVPGNHDAVRIAEPQPVIPYHFLRELWDAENVLMLSNPSQIEIFDKSNTPLNILLYHGYSFDYYVANVPEVRDAGGYDNIAYLMKFLLIKRHLAPTYGSTLYFPNQVQDYLVISKVPDVFASGHVHKLSIDEYKGIQLICSSCWQSRTSFQEKVGHHPEPARVPIFDPKTKKVLVLNFSKKEQK